MELQPGVNEIIPPKPLRASGEHSVHSEVRGEQVVLYSNQLGSCPVERDFYHTICLENGEMVRVEGFIYNDKGEKYEICVSGDGPIIELTPFCQSGDSIYLPKGKYTKIELIVDKPIKLNSIYWEVMACFEIR
ncbi:MAG: hypothetical protein D6687_08755 [Acidobacteria bacterium]|nr:MAG: hypothetical protein D6687_08755 [Acidobacteriota bacterium]GIU82228.1 MAG: hypothetical protein KatS3mg006_1292 [Pyrinomonadaceae bacterium]